MCFGRGRWPFRRPSQIVVDRACITSGDVSQ
jgi:hypothetical protein